MPMWSFPAVVGTKSLEIEMSWKERSEVVGIWFRILEIYVRVCRVFRACWLNLLPRNIIIICIIWFISFECVCSFRLFCWTWLVLGVVWSWWWPVYLARAEKYFVQDAGNWKMKIDFRDEESNIEHVLHSKSLRISIYERPQTRIDAPLCELPGSFPLHPVPLFPLG